jgi:hypothetical protein
MRNTKSNDLEMHVIKRNGKKEIISFDIQSKKKNFHLKVYLFLNKKKRNY